VFKWLLSLLYFINAVDVKYIIVLRSNYFLPLLIQDDGVIVAAMDATSHKVPSGFTVDVRKLFYCNNVRRWSLYVTPNLEIIPWHHLTRNDANSFAPNVCRVTQHCTSYLPTRNSTLCSTHAADKPGIWLNISLSTAPLR